MHISEPRRVQSQINREDGGKTDFDLLKAKVNFTGDCGGCVITRKLNLRAKGRRWNVHDRGQDLASLDIVIIDGLLAQECQIELVFFHHVTENLGNCKGLQFLVSAHVCLHVDAFVGAHSQCVSNHVNGPSFKAKKKVSAIGSFQLGIVEESKAA